MSIDKLVPLKVEPNKKIVKIKELKQSIDMHLEVVNDRLKQERIVDVEEVKNVLEMVESLINECYFLPEFKTNLYRNFDILVYSYQRLLLRKETADLEYKMEIIDEKIKTANKNVNKNNREMKDLRNIIKDITTNIISIILAISIIPTAITVLDNIDPEYVLPVLASVIFFGMNMLMFVFLIHKIKVDFKAIIIYIISLGVMIFFWLMPWKIEFTPKYTQKQQIQINLSPNSP